FAGAGIKHQLKDVNSQNQLIFVGPFSSKVAMDDYFKTINPLLSQIMKIKADQYNVFYITKPNFDKLNDRATIDQYIEFFKNY
ncbi:MAG: hypothetical protein WBP45_05705, partial [Daejeonella sp.]